MTLQQTTIINNMNKISIKTKILTPNKITRITIYTSPFHMIILLKIKSYQKYNQKIIKNKMTNLINLKDHRNKW